MRMMSRLAAALSVLVLAACGSGAPTTVNQPTTPPTVADYSGPPPATADVQAFRLALWENVKANNRCGGCHNATGEAPRFARNDDVNLAYAEATANVDLVQPDQSRLVTKVAGGHNCWLSSNEACADILTTWIRNWAGSTATGGTQIQLQAPQDRSVGDSRSFRDSATDGGSASFANTVWPLLRGVSQCARCHAPDSATPQAPFFASADMNEAYAAARQKIDLDNPANSRLVVRLRDEFHNCWSGSCTGDAGVMQAAIEAFVQAIPLTQVDPAWKVSRAITLYDGTVASGGNRFDTHAIARYEFKTGVGNTLYDTSGVEPALNLTLSGPVEWVGGWGINIKEGGKAQGTTTASRKLAERIKATGEYSIELWAAPANVTQEDAYLFSYSGGVNSRNVTLAQRAFQYEALARSSTTGANGAPALSTRDDDRLAQAALQHLVLTYDPVNGRRLYVNGVFTRDEDPRGGGTLGDWDDTFSLVLGNETSNNRQWQGVLRMVAVHSRALTEEQVQQNFAAGVGERYFLLFNVSALTGIPQAYIMFEGAVYDSYAYLFDRPVFISLDPDARPGSLEIKGMRIGMNGSEPASGQAYINLDARVTDAAYNAQSGQLLSDVGTIVAIQKGAEADTFFLSFEKIGDQVNVRTEAAPITPAPVDLPAQPDIGLRTFEQINQSFSRITGVATTQAGVRATYLQVQQQLPPVPNLSAFLASHQTGIAQLAIKYCSVMVDTPATRSAFFPALDTAMPAGAQFAGSGAGSGKDILVAPLLQKAIGTGLASQPADASVRTELEALIGKLVGNGANSVTVAKAACAAVLGSGAVSIL